MKKYLIWMIMMLVTCQVWAAAPKRLISADGSLTEIVYALHEEGRLVGVDTTSRYPEAAMELPKIGYKRSLSAEGALSLAPDHLIATEDAGPAEVLNQLRAVGVETDMYPAEFSLEGVRIKIEGVAHLLGKEAAGQQLWRDVADDVQHASERVKKITKPLRVLFVLSAADRSPTVGGRNTAADTMIKLAGGINVASEVEGYKPMTPEAIVAVRPEVILMMESGNNHAVSADDLFSKPGLSQTPAAKHNRLVSMDGMYLLGFGPRIGQAVAELVDAFYPALLVGK